MEEISYMNTSMTNSVKNIIAGALKYKDKLMDRTNYISDCLKDSFSDLNWCVIIYEDNHGYGSFKNAKTSYYYCGRINGSTIIVIGFKKTNK